MIAPTPNNPLKTCNFNLLVFNTLYKLSFKIIGKRINKPKKQRKKASWKGWSSAVKYFIIVPIIGKVAEASRINIKPLVFGLNELQIFFNLCIYS
tara:strand:+ start:325 stop:609 length:285 start_codon:yes stop_codon:yes gene_type:complete